MENREFWTNLQKNEAFLEKLNTTAQYRAETDKILQKYREKTAVSEEAEGGQAVEAVTPLSQQSPSQEPPSQESREPQEMQVMLDQMKALKDEVKLLRNQIEENSYDIYAVPRGAASAGGPQLILSNGAPRPVQPLYPGQQVQSMQAIATTKPADMSETMVFDRSMYLNQDGRDTISIKPGSAMDNAAMMNAFQGMQAAMAAAAMSGAAMPAVQPEPEIEAEDEEEETKGKKKFAWVGEVAFYLMLVLLIVGAILIKSNSGGRPITIAGYSAFTVLTSSMESVIPQGSLVITKDVDPNTLMIGDDITYMVSETTSVTHRIIGITENYANTGQRGFETKGVMNPQPDKEIVAAANVVGKVVFHNKILGKIGGFANKNWPYLVFAMVVIFGLMAFLKWNFRETDEEPEKPDKPKKKKKKKKKKDNDQEEGSPDTAA